MDEMTCCHILQIITEKQMAVTRKYMDAKDRLDDAEDAAAFAAQFREFREVSEELLNILDSKCKFLEEYGYACTR